MLARVLHSCEVPLLVLVPVVLITCAVFQVQQTALLSIMVVAATLVVFFAGFEASKPPLRQIMPTVVLAALAVAGRIIFAPIPNFKPVTAICIIAGIAFGKRSGFMVGALAALVSNFFFGQGPWTAWQMYAWGLIGYLFGALATSGLFDKHERSVYVLGTMSPLLYGLILNGYYVVGFVRPIEVATVLLAYGAGLPPDLIHCAATGVFLCLLHAPWRKKLKRIKTKYDLRLGEAT